MSEQCPHNISRRIYVSRGRCCADLVRTLCGHISPGIYVSTKSALYPSSDFSFLVSAISIVGMDWNSLAGRSAVRSAGLLVLASSLAGLVRSEAEPQFTFESSSRYGDFEI